MTNTESVIEKVLDLYLQHGHDDYIGEPVTQLEHMSQSAELAIEEGYDDEVVLAAFFHDIGHLCVSKNEVNDMNGLGIKDHEEIGAEYLRILGFSERLTQLVNAHVEAKRYLCYKHPEYYEKLSPASRGTLELQGGKMDSEEAQRFESNPLSPLFIKLREWDDRAKKVGIPVIDLNKIAERISRVLK